MRPREDQLPSRAKGKVHLHGDVKRWSDLKPGALFYVVLGGEACVGMKAVGPHKDGDTFDRCVIFTPSKQERTPHVYPLGYLQDRPLLELSDAVFVPGEPADWELLPDAGDLVQTPDGAVLTVLNLQDHGRRDPPSVNLSSGQYSTQRPQQDFIVFKGWKIVLPSAMEGEDDKSSANGRSLKLGPPPDANPGRALRVAAVRKSIDLAEANGNITNVQAHGFVAVEPFVNGNARLRATITVDGLRALAMRAPRSPDL